MMWPHTRDTRGHQQERREGPPTARRSTARHAVTAVLGLRTGRGQTSGAPAAQLWSPLPEPGHCVGGGIEHKAGRSSCTTYVFNVSLRTLMKLTVLVSGGRTCLRPTGRDAAACR